ncbi:MAG: FlgD immunoglobulin-like domain containing protein [Candidatus Latescibacteria bacterium]|jgi:hypothetical protein|nr:FlgD immunoglobulin-like domain containing protein [Candidatus Latescibacterota bacterium]
MKRIEIVSLTMLLVATSVTVWAQDDEADLVFQTARTDAYETYLDVQEEALQAQLDAGADVDAAQMSLILVKLARIQQEADRTVEQISDAARDIDEALNDALDDNDLDDDVEARIDSAGDDIGDALGDFGEVLDVEGGEIADLAEDLRASDAPFEVTVRIESDSQRFDEVVTIARSDFDDLEELIEDGQDSGRSLGDALSELEAAVESWGDALDWLDIATSTEDNQAAIDAMRTAVSHLDSSYLALEAAFDSSPLGVTLDTGESRATLADVDDILDGRTFAVGSRTVRPIALIENRTAGAFLDDNLLQIAFVLSRMSVVEFSNADDHETTADLFEEGSEEAAFYRARTEKAQIRGWTWILLTAGAMGLSGSVDDMLIEFWSSSSPDEETLRGYFPEGMSAAMLQVLGVDLVVNTWVPRDEMDDHMTVMRELYETRISQDDTDSEAYAGLAIVRTYFLVTENHQDLLDVIELTVDGDIIGIVDRFDTEDFDYSATVDSIEQDLDRAREDADLVFLVLDKLDDDGLPFDIEIDDDVVPLPLTGATLDTGLDIIGALATAAAALAEAGGETLERVEESLELDLDPNELDLTDTETPLDVALALEVSNPDFLRLSPEGVDDVAKLGDDMEDALAEFSDAVTEFSDLAVDLEEEDGTGVAGLAGDFDDFYQDVRHDFSDQPATTVIDGEPVDLSAWFDHPPEQVLQHFIWFLDDDDDTDNTLAGLLPGRSVQSVVLEERLAPVPEDFALGQNYPNPFNSGTVIEFQLPVDTRISLKIHDVLGREVLRLSQGERTAGSYRVLWDGADAAGEPLASGVYYYRLQAGDHTLTRSLLLLR